MNSKESETTSQAGLSSEDNECSEHTPHSDSDKNTASASNNFPLPDIDFSTFILSLSTSAMMHLDETPLPQGTVLRDLEMAKQTIDILGILKDKTKGNLTPDEKRLLDELLCDLRLRYVSIIK